MKKDNSANIKKYIFSTFFVLLLLTEIFVAINYPDQFLWMIGIGVLILINNYLLIHSLTKEVKKEKEQQTKQLQHIDRSKKALYILFKKNFMDLDKRMYDVEKSVVPISNELETNQKKMEDVIVQSMEDNRKVAKIIIGRNKENAEALMNYNGELAERLRVFEEKLGEIENKVSNVRATDSIVSNATMDVVAPVAEVETMGVEAPMVEMETMNDVVAPVTEVLEESIQQENIVSETAMPDLGDPNKMMSPDDIAALLAGLGGDIQEGSNNTEEENVEDIFVEPEIGVMDDVMPEEAGIMDDITSEATVPDLGDPNKPMSPEDIAALLASINGDIDEISNESDQEELEFEAMEEKEAPDFSDSNKIMSPEDIAALIANM